MTTNLDIPQEQRFFGPDDVGCHADDTFGHQHVRNTLAALIETLDGGLGNEDAQALQESLEGTMPDDAWDEIEALDILQQNTTDDLSWELEGGLILVPLSEIEA